MFEMTISLTGLSPRVRGSRTDGYTTATDEGSIPACAGEPMTTSLSLQR